MASYPIRAAYTPEAWAKMVKSPQDRKAAIASMIEKLGGRLESFWLSFGDYDAHVILQAPDNVSVAALSLATAAGGSVKAVKTTPLMTMDEGMEAMRKVAVAGYRPPG
ncbi:MAG TPA: GYD domain-containing protein [Burkholderiales bacterium]|nr:GYD domain-containing protein [Burkholderiales bacterium]